MTMAIRILALMMLAGAPAGCTLAVGAAGGAVAGSELEEDDGEFDPLEDTEVGEEIYE